MLRVYRKFEMNKSRLFANIIRKKKINQTNMKKMNKTKTNRQKTTKAKQNNT